MEKNSELQVLNLVKYIFCVCIDDEIDIDFVRILLLLFFASLFGLNNKRGREKERKKKKYDNQSKKTKYNEEKL
mgnify:CR=1 FL=1